MDFSITTPGLLFSASTLLLLGYTNRFLAIAALARELYAGYLGAPTPDLAAQINNLKTRLLIVRRSQAFGLFSLLTCGLSMLSLFAGANVLGKFWFVVSLASMIGSLALALREVQICTDALGYQLCELGDERD